MNPTTLWSPLAISTAVVLLAATLFLALSGSANRGRIRRRTDGGPAPMSGWQSHPIGRLAHGVPARLATVRRRRDDRAPIPADAVSAWCDALARRLRAGESLRHTLLTELPAQRRLAARTELVRRALQQGAAVTDAVVIHADQPAGCAPLPSPHADPHLGLLRSVLAASADFGGGAAEPIDRVAAALRLRTVDGQERAAQSAQAKLSANVLTVVPLGLLAFLSSTDPDVRAVLGSGVGSVLIAAGLGLNVAGWTWMKRTIAGGPS